MPMYDRITPEQADLIATSEMFFVASVAPDMSLGTVGEGPVNVSPKGGTLLQVDDREALADGAPDGLAVRQVITVEVSSTQTSCGYGVPRYDFVARRPREARGTRFKARPAG